MSLKGWGWRLGHPSLPYHLLADDLLPSLLKLNETINHHNLTRLWKSEMKNFCEIPFQSGLGSRNNPRKAKNAATVGRWCCYFPGSQIQPAFSGYPRLNSLNNSPLLVLTLFSWEAPHLSLVEDSHLKSDLYRSCHLWGTWASQGRGNTQRKYCHNDSWRSNPRPWDQVPSQKQST